MKRKRQYRLYVKGSVPVNDDSEAEFEATQGPTDVPADVKTLGAVKEWLATKGELLCTL
jgi:hypothetical protein